MKIPSKEEIREIKKRIESIKAEIMILLERGTAESYTELCSLMEKENVMTLSGKDSELFIMEIMSNIQREEMKQNVSHCVFEGRNMQELEKLYRTIVFYLRRLEFDLEKELQQELLPYMLDQQLSIVCIYGVIQVTTYIYSKERTIKAFVNLLENC